MAHHTQATEPGWLYIAQSAGGAGVLSGGGAFTALVDPPTGGFTLIIYKPSGGTSEDATFTLSGPAAGVAALHAVRSTVTKSQEPDPSQYFLAQPDVPVSGGAFSLTLRPGDMWTLSTVATMRKGTTPAPPPAPAPFPDGAYADDFDGCAVSQEAAYWTDMSGVFECVADPTGSGRGVVMQQQVPVRPVAWWPDPNGGTTDQRPFSVFQASMSFVDTDASLDVALAAASDTGLVGARANPNCSPVCNVLDGENSMPGLWWAFDGSGRWTLANAVINVTGTAGQLGSGKLPAVPAPGAWHTYRLVVSAGLAAGYMDGSPVFSGVRVQGAVPDSGFVGLGTGSWGQHVLFDRFNLTASSKGRDAAGRHP